MVEKILPFDRQRGVERDRESVIQSPVKGVHVAVFCRDLLS